MMVKLVLAVALSATICACLVPLLSRLARYTGLVDRPDFRKFHRGEVPIVGGVAIYLAVLLTTLVIHPTWWSLSPLAVGFGLVIMGVLDDRFSLNHVFRLLVQIVTALCMVFVGQIGIESIGNIAGYGPVVLGGTISIVFTVVCTVGVINSINMIDGVDGLSGAIISIMLMPLTLYAWRAGDMNSVLLMLSFQAALAVFLYFNSRFFRPKAAIFMGDAGSMLSGFFLVWYFIRLTQGENPPLSPVAAGWIFGVPLVDTISVMVGRILDRQSPLKADRNHLHHRLLSAGLSTNQTVLIIAFFQCGFIAIGIICNEVPQLEPLLFWIFTMVVVIHHFFTPRFIKWILRVITRRDGYGKRESAEQERSL